MALPVAEHVIASVCAPAEWPESFNGKRRVTYGEIFYTLTEASVLIEGWRRQYNTKPLLIPTARCRR